jgi:hypothetical protein
MLGITWLAADHLAEDAVMANMTLSRCERGRCGDDVSSPASAMETRQESVHFHHTYCCQHSGEVKISVTGEVA